MVFIKCFGVNENLEFQKLKKTGSWKITPHSVSITGRNQMITGKLKISRQKLLRRKTSILYVEYTCFLHLMSYRWYKNKFTRTESVNFFAGTEYGNIENQPNGQLNIYFDEIRKWAIFIFTKFGLFCTPLNEEK